MIIIKYESCIFSKFGINPEVQQSTSDPTYLYNTMLIEIANNWPFVRWLLCQYREKILSNVDPIEQEWLNFIVSNNIDVEKYQKDSNLFLDENIKNYV